MHFDLTAALMLPAIEERLHNSISPIKDAGVDGLYHMLAYHLGWEGEGAGPQATGKRIRPLLVTMTTTAAGGNWEQALPAAAAIELLHNFSLIHDDIQDKSLIRRGRPTIWVKWGIPHAINAGDTMFSLANLAILDLMETSSTQVTLDAARLFHHACLHLTEGQYLDISYEDHLTLDLEKYWPMVRGKTAALIATCTEIGALVAQADNSTRGAFRQFGHYLGLAFQVQDDLLGIWGDAALTGKSNQSDLLEGKKSLPVLFGLQQGGIFAARWIKGDIKKEEVNDLARQLELEGALDYTQNKADELTQDALQALNQANPHGHGGTALVNLANQLLNRRK